jgi:tetrapyrrole methylase family protein/MazG family protein
MDWLSSAGRALQVLGLDVSELQLASAVTLATRHYPSLSPDRPALVGPLGGADLLLRLEALLRQVYPAGHGVTVVAGLDGDQPEAQGLALSELARASCSGLSLLYLPPLDCPGAVETFQSTVAHLRAPDGCPWDREQTHRSLRDGFLEEAYEVLDALDQGDLELLKEELGDVLLHILLQAQIASESGEFLMSDVVCYVNQKIVYRHPHVFDGLAVDGVDQVLENWETLKREEKGRDQGSGSLFDGIPRALPALARTQALLRRAERMEAEMTWDAWAEQAIRGVQRLGVEQDQGAKMRLLGDMLFASAALARRAELDAETALREVNARFEQRALDSRPKARLTGQQEDM